MGAKVVPHDQFKLCRGFDEFLRRLRGALAGQTGVHCGLFSPATPVRWEDGTVERAVIGVFMDAATGRVVRQRVDKASAVNIHVQVA